MQRILACLLGAVLVLNSGNALAASKPSIQPHPQDSQEYQNQTNRQQPLAAPAGPTFGCLPTCSEVDGRFLALSSGTQLAALSTQELTLRVIAGPGAGTFEIAIFDGDSGGEDTNGQSHWDSLLGSFTYSVMADVDRDGIGDIQAIPSQTSTAMPDHSWFQMQIPRMPEAEAPNGNYFYVLQIVNTDPAATVLNSFKIRVEGFLSIPAGQPFALFPSITNLADAEIIYPGFPDTSTTTYDGSFRLFIDVPGSEKALEIWDGDFDFGSIDGSTLDTDDPSTPNDPFVPLWANPLARAEGIATGDPGTTGSPADDGDALGTGRLLVRSPSPTYRLQTPKGEVFTNQNPSGNQEWEQFRISKRRNDPIPYDFLAQNLKKGLYFLEALGIDLQNSIFLKLDHQVICVDSAGDGCPILR